MLVTSKQSLQLRKDTQIGILLYYQRDIPTHSYISGIYRACKQEAFMYVVSANFASSIFFFMNNLTDLNADGVL